MAKPDPIRWGIVGTANIARAQFLPGLREAGGGRATRVASRDRAKAEAYATAQGIDQGIEGYAALVESPDIDAVYVALPNALHAEPTIRALRAGKAVLCEKPLSVGAAQTRDVLDVAAHRRPAAVGGVRLPLPGPAPAARAPARGRGDRRARPSSTAPSTSCCPTRPTSGWTPPSAAARWPTSAATPSASRSSSSARPRSGDGAESARRACAASHRERGRHRRGRHRHLRRPAAPAHLRLQARLDTFSSVLGSDGQIQLTNPFHPGPADTLTISRPNADPVIERPTTDQRSFTAAIRHIHAVLRGDGAPVHTAAEYALPAARVLEELQRLACGRLGRRRGAGSP